MPDAVVTPNEIARRLGVTGLQFRNWLRAQKAAGHPLLVGHQYRTRYAFTRARLSDSNASLLAKGASVPHANARSRA